MKRLEDFLLSREATSEIVMGNTALVRAMIEAGVRVATTYPGSPTPEIAAALTAVSPEKRPYYFEYSTNEKVATEVAFGASLNGHLSCVFFKSVGLNVAADSFVQLAHMETPGGMVIVLGDDPGAHSSQNEQDNRHYARLSYTPMLEPSFVPDVYAMFLEAVRLSREKRMPVMLRLTTHVCHAKERVQFGPWDPEAFSGGSPFSPKEGGPWIPIGKNVPVMKRRALRKLEEVADWAETSPFNTVWDHGNVRRGIITAGQPLMTLADVLEDIPEKNRPDVLRLGTVNPLPRERILDFIEAHHDIKVIEELDDFLEQQIKAMAYEVHLEVRIRGKETLEEWIGEYTPDRVEDILRLDWSDLFPAEPEIEGIPEIAPRPPQMCPGCGHRSAFFAVGRVLEEDTVSVADIGCHTLGFLPPYELGQVLLSMGHSTGTASGLALYGEGPKKVAFIGDSTLFHAGLPGIINALFNGHELTLVVMENGTTAMTGHQDHPGSGKNANGPAEAIPIRRVLEALGAKDIAEVDTYSQAKLEEAIRGAQSRPGFSVVIARHPCMLKFTREQRRKEGYVPRKVLVDPELCEKIHTCVSDFACPSFQREPDGSVWAHPDLCIGDGSCLQTCPTRAIRFPGRDEEVSS